MTRYLEYIGYNAAERDITPWKSIDYRGYLHNL